MSGLAVPLRAGTVRAAPSVGRPPSPPTSAPGRTRIPTRRPSSKSPMDHTGQSERAPLRKAVSDSTASDARYGAIPSRHPLTCGTSGGDADADALSVSSSGSDSSWSQESAWDEEAEEAKEARRRRNDFLIGTGLLACVVTMWTSANFITADVVSNSNTGPFTVTYMNTSTFLLYFLPFASSKSHFSDRSHHKRRKRASWFQVLGFIWPPSSAATEDLTRGRSTEVSVWRSRLGLPTPSSPLPTANGIRSASSGQVLVRSRTTPPSHPATGDGMIDPELLSAVLAETTVPKAHSPPLTVAETRRIAFWFAVQWFAANWTVNSALGLTNVASATTISSAQSLFTLVIGFIYGIEHFAPSKAAATLATLIGVALVANADTQASSSKAGFTSQVFQGRKSAMIGDLLSLLSAYLFASYVVYLKRTAKEDSRLSMPFFFGWVGIWAVLLYAPVGLILHLTGIEPIVLPETSSAWIGMGANMFITFASDLFYMLAMLKSTPLLATVGISLTIPLAAIIEAIWGGKTQHWTQMIGDALVLGAFVAVGLSESTDATTDAVEAIHQEYLAEHERLDSLANSLDLAVDPEAAIAALPRGNLRRMALSRSRSSTPSRPEGRRRIPSRAPIPYPSGIPSHPAIPKGDSGNA